MKKIKICLIGLFLPILNYSQTITKPDSVSIQKDEYSNALKISTNVLSEKIKIIITNDCGKIINSQYINSGELQTYTCFLSINNLKEYCVKVELDNTIIYRRISIF